MPDVHFPVLLTRFIPYMASTEWLAILNKTSHFVDTDLLQGCILPRPACQSGKLNDAAFVATTQPGNLPACGDTGREVGTRGGQHLPSVGIVV